MKFELVPILTTMKELYEEPASMDRFKNYLNKLQGPIKGDLQLPIGGYNPMAKDHILNKIQELENLGAEAITIECLEELSGNFKSLDHPTIRVVLNLADDFKGGWTNKFTTDYDSKFKINALINRNFCTPYFFSSENYSENMIRERTKSYALRSIFWIQNGKPQTLSDLLQQEVFVHSNTDINSIEISENIESRLNHFERHKNSEEYTILFNFFYGDEISKSLGYPSHGYREFEGFKIAKYLAKQK